MFYYSNDNYNSNLSASYTAGQSTMSAISVPLKVPTYLTFGFGTDKECVYVITGKTTNSLTGVSWVRGYTGNLDAQMTIACLNNEDFLNQVAGAVSTPETLSNNIYGSDGGGTDAYSISLESPPSAYEEGLVIFFKANTANTGGATINVNSLGDKDIKKNGTVDLTTNDILASQIVGVVYDGTNFQMVGGNTAKASSDEVTEGAEENKFITPKALADSDYAKTSDITVTADSTTTFSNKRINPRIVTAASYTTDTGTALDVSTCDEFDVTAQAGALKLNNPSGSPVNGQKLIVRIKDNGTARALTYDTQFRASSDLALPTTTVLGKTLYMGFIFNATDTKWDLLAVLNNI